MVWSGILGFYQPVNETVQNRIFMQFAFLFLSPPRRFVRQYTVCHCCFWFQRLVHSSALHRHGWCYLSMSERCWRSMLCMTEREKHRPAQFLFWSESSSWIETSWLSAKLMLLDYMSALSAVHLKHLLPKRGTDFAQEHQTEAGGSTWLQQTTKSSQHQTPVQRFLSANAFHPVASFTSRLGLCLHLYLPRIKSLLPPPTW